MRSNIVVIIQSRYFLSNSKQCLLNADFIQSIICNLTHRTKKTIMFLMVTLPRIPPQGF